MNGRYSLPALAVLLAAVAAFSFLCFVFFPESVDDAYITLRFSRNLAEGKGPVFNPGERVEGYSNFLWMAVLAAAGGAGAPPEYAMKVLGFASGVAVIALVFAAARRETGDPLAAACAALFFGASPYAALWAVDGLETVFYSAILAALFHICARGDDRDSPLASAAAGCVAAEAALCRPEGILYAAVALLFEATRRRGGRWRALPAISVFSVIFLSYAAFRYCYFGALVPNTALAKVHFGTGSVSRGLMYLNLFNVQSGYVVLPLAIAGMTNAAASRYTKLLVSFVAAQVVFLTVSGGDFMYAYRFVVPAMPFLGLLCVNSAAAAARRLGRPPAAAAMMISVCALVFFSQYSSLPHKRIAADNLTWRAGAHFEAADYLSKAAAPGESVMLSEAGIIPYILKGNPVTDYLGLVSDYAKVNRNGDVDLEYLFSQKPAYVVLTSVESGGASAPRLYQDKKIAAFRAFGSGYEPVKKIALDRSRSLLEALYYRNDPEADRIFFEIFRRKK